MAVRHVGGDDPSGLDILRKFSVLLHHFLIYRQIVLILRDAQPHKLASRFLQLRRDDIFFFCHIHGKGNKSRRHIDILESTGHTVFASDGRKTESKLGRIGSKESGKGLAPAVGVLRHPTEVLLESKADLPVVAACCHDLGHRLCHSVDRSVVGAPA